MELVLNQIDNQVLLKTVGIKRFSEKISSKVTSFLVFLMLAQVIASATIFNRLQIVIEILILVLLLSLILVERRLQREEITLLAIFLFSQVGSLLVNDLTTFMLNAKQYGLAVFSLVYFRRHHRKSFIIPLAFTLSIILILAQRFIFHRFPFEIAHYLGTLSNEMATRPLGLFLNFHFSAFFLAICLIGYTHKRRAFFLDYYLLWIMDVKTSIFSYVGQKIMLHINHRSRLFRSNFAQWSLLVGTIFFLGIFLDEILNIFRLYYRHGYNSGKIIFSQMINPETYLNAIYLFPSDMLEHSQRFSYLSKVVKHDGANESFFIVCLVQGGFVLALAYLFLLTKTLSRYRMFILLSLIHYSHIFSPLIIYTMCMFEHRIQEGKMIPASFSGKYVI